MAVTKHCPDRVSDRCCEDQTLHHDDITADLLYVGQTHTQCARLVLIETKCLRQWRILVNACLPWVDSLWITASDQSLLDVYPKIALVDCTTTPLRLAS